MRLSLVEDLMFLEKERVERGGGEGGEDKGDF